MRRKSQAEEGPAACSPSEHHFSPGPHRNSPDKAVPEFMTTIPKASLRLSHVTAWLYLFYSPFSDWPSSESLASVRPCLYFPPVPDGRTHRFLPLAMSSECPCVEDLLSPFSKTLGQHFTMMKLRFVFLSLKCTHLSVHKRYIPENHINFSKST